MRKETEAWWKQAQEDFDDAQFNFEGERYKTASFLCQQAVEKAFKAFLIEKKERLRKIHDLVELSREIGIPAHLLAGIKELTLAYASIDVFLLNIKYFLIVCGNSRYI